LIQSKPRSNPLIARRGLLTDVFVQLSVGSGPPCGQYAVGPGKSLDLYLLAQTEALHLSLLSDTNI
jgi:hypothetical protein